MELLAGILLGGIAGFAYRKFFGCNQSCAIYKNNLSSIAYGALIGLLITTSSCAQKNEEQTVAAPVVETAKQVDHKLNNEEFAAKMTSPEHIILDVRTPAEFSSGHLPDAVNININSPEFNSEINKLDKNKTYLIYCKSGMRSEKAYDVMSNSGFSSLFTLESGIASWNGEVVQ